MCCAACSSGVCKRRVSMHKRLLIDSPLGLVTILRRVTLLGVYAVRHDMVVGHVGRWMVSS
jgi:hypothetical protein